MFLFYRHDDHIGPFLLFYCRPFLLVSKRQFFNIPWFIRLLLERYLTTVGIDVHGRCMHWILNQIHPGKSLRVVCDHEKEPIGYLNFRNFCMPGNLMKFKTSFKYITYVPEFWVLAAKVKIWKQLSPKSVVYFYFLLLCNRPLHPLLEPEALQLSTKKSYSSKVVLS